MTKIPALLICCLFFCSGLYAQKDHSLLRKGDKDYKSQDYGEAEEHYRKALEKKNTSKGNYNLGNAIYQQDRYDEAVRRYENAISSTSDEATRAKAYHNLGNAYFNQEDYEKSVEAYKNALRLNPKDLETKINLAQAQRLKLQQQQQQQQQQQDQEQEQQEEQEQQQQQQQNQDQEDQQQQQQQQSDQQQQQEQEQEMQKEKDLSKEEARQKNIIINHCFLRFKVKY